MRKLVMVAGIMTLSAQALANQCPQQLAPLDQHLEEHGSMLSAEQANEAQTLRAQAEEDHEAGRHDQALQAISKARKIIGM